MPEPTISSKRLILRFLRNEDIESTISYYKENRSRLEPSGPAFGEDFLRPGFWLRQVERNKAEFASGESLRLFLFSQSDQSKVIGHISLSGILRSVAQLCYLGYGIDKEFEGKGLMQEILPLVFSYAFTELKLHRISAAYMPTNLRSERLLQKLGFTKEGIAKEYLFLDGKWQDHVVCSLINPNGCPVYKENWSS